MSKVCCSRSKAAMRGQTASAGVLPRATTSAEVFGAMNAQPRMRMRMRRGSTRREGRGNTLRVSAVEDGGSGGLAALNFFLGVGAIAGGAKVFQIVSDPEARRQKMASEAGGNELKSVGDYFEGEGFQRWRRIYDEESDDVNKVQKDIRDGHAMTIDIALNWLGREKLEGMTICDAGCGTGSLAIPLALKGAKVSASDISSAMVEEAGRRYDAAAGASSVAVRPSFEAKDLESVDGKYNTVTCLDVVIHYPDSKMAGMIKHLTDCAEDRVIMSFAPKTPYYSFLKRVGELFPGKSKATRAYLHAEEDIEATFNRLGWKIVKRDMTATSFYFSRIVEAVKA